MSQQNDHSALSVQKNNSPQYKFPNHHNCPFSFPFLPFFSVPCYQYAKPSNFLHFLLRIICTIINIKGFKQMITSLFLTIPPGTTYEQLKNNLHFVEDFAGVTNWVMRFPRIVYSVDLKIKHTFNQNQVDVEKVVNPSLQQRWKYFVITKGDGVRYYCTAQVYYEKAPLKCKESGLFQASREIFREFYVPKCLVLMSDMPYYKIQVNLLKVYRELKKTEPIISHAINEGLYKVYLYLLQNQREEEWQHITVKQPNESKKITPSTEFTFNYYINSCNQHKHGEAIFIQKSTNREVLHLYKLYNQSLYEICYIFHLPFSSGTLRLILSAILQEKQIIFTSNNQNLAALIIQTLMRMILPFKWCYMYVPNLPTHLIEPAEESFMPYIVGIHKKNLSLIDTSERVVVYVEEDKVVYHGELHLFHQGLCEYLAYANSDSKNYLQWEKEIRIKSILLIHNVLENCFNQERMQQQQQQMFLRQSTTSLAQSSTTILYPDQLSSAKLISNPSFSSATLGTARETQHSLFIKQFVSNSMMFKNFKEDRARGLTEQTSKILQVPREHRRGFLLHNFNLLTSQAQYPARYDNEKKWIKYYERVNRSRRKFRFNRYSLNSLDQSRTPRSLKYSTTNASMIASTVRLGERNTLAQSNIFH